MDGQQERVQNVTAADLDSAGESRLRRLEHHVWTRIASGFLVLVPVLVTYLILRVLVGYFDGLFQPLVNSTPLDFTGFGVLVTVVAFYIVGAFFAGKRSQALQDAVLTKVPIVKSIYGVARQATEALSSPKGHHFSRVVFLEWPRPGVRAMGFVTGHIHAPDEDSSAMVVVYIPTVPNPTSGMLAWVAEDELIETNFTVEQAMKAVFSGGIVLPDMPDRQVLQASSRLDQGPAS